MSEDTLARLTVSDAIVDEDGAFEFDSIDPGTDADGGRSNDVADVVSLEGEL